ncbi:ribonucleoprotein PTB-binding 2 isoform X13 [Tursiops truncatus]
MFHQYSFRGKDLIVQLQPTDALLCITNLPTSFTLEEFEELVRAYGNVERCFLVYSEVTGHSKGYGFVEYMKKDFAAKARLELLGKQLGASAVFAQWMDVNLLAAELIHSKCLCIDKLPSDYRDSEELLQFFSSIHKPVFCQLAQDEGSYVGGFAVVEYSTAEHAEEVQQAADGMTIKGSKVQVSFCAPGAPGRSTLAALIAAQRVMHSNQKGLLPEPNPVQIMKSLNNPAMLQVLLQPQLCGRTVKPAVLGTPHSLPHLMNPSISPAFLHLNKAHQSSLMGNTSNLFLQNLSHVPLAQQQLMKFENIHTNNKPGLLGEPPAMVLQAAVGIGSPLPLKTELGHLGETHKTSNLIPPQTTITAGMGMLPFLPNQHIAGQAGPGHGNTQEKQPALVGMAEGNFSGSQAYLQSFPNLTAGGLLTGHHKQQQSQPKGLEISSGPLQVKSLYRRLELQATFWMQSLREMNRSTRWRSALLTLNLLVIMPRHRSYKLCQPMFTAALFTTAKTWKQPRCPSTDERIKKMWFICTVDYYSAIKERMDPEISILSEVRERHIPYDTYMWNLKYDTGLPWWCRG